ANKNFGLFDSWFLAEASVSDEIWFAWNWFAHLNVTKSGMSCSRLDPGRDQRTLFFRSFYRIANNFLKCRCLFNRLIGRQDNHCGGVIARGDPGYAERDGRGSITF